MALEWLETRLYGSPEHYGLSGGFVFIGGQERPEDEKHRALWRGLAVIAEQGGGYWAAFGLWGAGERFDSYKNDDGEWIQRLHGVNIGDLQIIGSGYSTSKIAQDAAEAEVLSRLARAALGENLNGPLVWP
jgi:hypothetical protein